jgi:hypothetical protein
MNDMVELVIKIPEDVYTRLFDNGIQDNEIAVDDICEMARALRMGTPLEEELEKIKAEIKKESYELFDCPDAFVVEFADVERIMDKHISELKGE